MGKNCSLAPGFRFHPTDEELVWYYLRRKVTGKSFRVDAISEIDIYKVEPNDLPGLSKLKSRDLEWYFFSGLDRKYGNGSRTNRATNEGYWKTTGKDRPVYHKSQVVGMKKTLVYHKGRAPRGERSNWVMHEYKLSDDVFNKSAFQDGFVLCRVFQKSGTGPKNGEQYGAPLVEEEWEDDEHSGVVEPTEVSFEDPYVDDNSYLEQIDLDQAIDFQIPENVPFPNPVSSSNFGDIQDMTGTDQNCTVDESEDKFCLDDLVGQKLPEAVQDQNNAYVVKNEYMIQPNDTNSEAALDLPDQLFSDNAPMDGNDIFFDISNFPDPVQDEVDFGFFESCLDDLNFELPDLANQRLTDDDINANWQEPDAREQLHGAGDDNISSSLHVTEYSKAEPSKNDQHSWLSLLENIPAPPAFASEYPSKDVAARLSAAVQSSNSVTTGIIRIRDMPVGVNGSGIQWSFDKAGNINVRLSFDIPEVVSLSPAGLESLTCLLSNKISSATSRGWLWFIFFLVFAFGLSVKIGTCIFAK